MKWEEINIQNLPDLFSNFCFCFCFFANMAFIVKGKHILFQANEKDTTLFPESSFLFYVCKLSLRLGFNVQIIFSVIINNYVCFSVCHHQFY